MNSFNSHSIPIKWILLSSPFLRCGNWDPEKWRDWPVVSQLRSGRARLPRWYLGSRSTLFLNTLLYCLLVLKWSCNSTLTLNVFSLRSIPHITLEMIFFKMLFSWLKYFKASQCPHDFSKFPLWLGSDFSSLNSSISWHTIYTSEIPRYLQFPQYTMCFRVFAPLTTYNSVCLLTSYRDNFCAFLMT